MLVPIHCEKNMEISTWWLRCWNWCILPKAVGELTLVTSVFIEEVWMHILLRNVKRLETHKKRTEKNGKEKAGTQNETMKQWSRQSRYTNKQRCKQTSKQIRKHKQRISKQTNKERSNSQYMCQVHNYFLKLVVPLDSLWRTPSKHSGGVVSQGRTPARCPSWILRAARI